jgi:hypothetical protein
MGGGHRWPTHVEVASRAVPSGLTSYIQGGRYGPAWNAPGVALSCLIVDDNVDYCRRRRALLQQEGIDVVGVATAAPRRSSESPSSCPRSPSETSTSARKTGSIGPGSWPGAHTVLGPPRPAPRSAIRVPICVPWGPSTTWYETKRCGNHRQARWIGSARPSQRGSAQRPRLLPYLVNGREGQTPSPRTANCEC